VEQANNVFACLLIHAIVWGDLFGLRDADHSLAEVGSLRSFVPRFIGQV
jgi:hypothetical protein